MGCSWVVVAARAESTPRAESNGELHLGHPALKDRANQKTKKWFLAVEPKKVHAPARSWSASHPMAKKAKKGKSSGKKKGGKSKSKKGGKSKSKSSSEKKSADDDVAPPAAADAAPYVDPDPWFTSGEVGHTTTREVRAWYLRDSGVLRGPYEKEDLLKWFTSATIDE